MTGGAAPSFDLEARFCAALNAVGFPGSLVPLAARLARGTWGKSRWTQDADGVWTSAGEHSVRNADNAWALDRSTLLHISAALHRAR